MEDLGVARIHASPACLASLLFRYLSHAFAVADDQFLIIGDISGESHPGPGGGDCRKPKPGELSTSLLALQFP